MAKIVRDKILQNITESGEVARGAILKKSDAVRGLSSKMLEELEELILANTHSDRISELSDVLEIVRAIALQYKIEWGELIDCADRKRLRNGGFEALKILLDDQSGELPEEVEGDTELSLAELNNIRTKEGCTWIPFSILVGTIGGESAFISGSDIKADLQFSIKAGALVLTRGSHPKV